LDESIIPTTSLISSTVTSIEKTDLTSIISSQISSTFLQTTTEITTTSEKLVSSTLDLSTTTSKILTSKIPETNSLNSKKHQIIESTSPNKYKLIQIKVLLIS
jgi:hypothetical protein